ncbi:hypothetical protein TWF281_000021 [Arthrobotrys megalospora]
MGTSTAAIRGPFHSSEQNTDHTTKSGTKPTTGTEIITDTSFAPTLESAPFSRYLKSFFVLSILVACVCAGACYIGLDFLQTTSQQWAIIASVTIGLFYSGVVWIDWWEIIVEYWWLSIPLLAGIGMVMIRMDEATRAVDELD